MRNYNLTEREKEVLRLVACGYSNKKIAIILSLALSTVKSHVRNIYLKIDLYRVNCGQESDTMRVRAAIYYWQKFNDCRIDVEKIEEV